MTTHARYGIVQEVGRGAISAVYAARDRKTGGLVALKRLDPALSSGPGASLAGRFLKQARSAGRLKHPNIVRINEAGEAGGTAYVAMELLEGENLRKILDDGPLPLARAIRFARDVAHGLAYAHMEGVVHAGLTPWNVIVLPSGVVKITDFGTGQGALLPGTRARLPSYLSPEQVRGDALDHRCDVFSLGVLLYELLTRRRPFEGGSPKEIMENILHAKARPPSELNPHVPHALDAIVLGMLAGQPGARMPGIPILLAGLQRLEEGLGLGSGAEPAASVPRAGPKRASGWRRAVYAALVLALGAVGVGLAGFRYFASGASEGASRPRAPAPVSSGILSAPQPMPAKPLLPKPPPRKPLAVQPAPPAPVEKPVVLAPRHEHRRVSRPAAKASKPQPGGMARLILKVSPRGDIYIDGTYHGSTPPTRALELEPGMHRIEVRDGSRKPFLTYIAVQAGDVRRIRHVFGTSRGAPAR